MSQALVTDSQTHVRPPHILNTKMARWYRIIVVLAACLVVQALARPPFPKHSGFPYCRCHDYDAASNPIRLRPVAESPSINAEGVVLDNEVTVDQDIQVSAERSDCYNQLFDEGIQKIEFKTTAGVCNNLNVEVYLNGKRLSGAVDPKGFVRVHLGSKTPVELAAAGTRIRIVGSGDCNTQELLQGGPTFKYSVFNWDSRGLLCCPTSSSASPPSPPVFIDYPSPVSGSGSGSGDFVNTPNEGLVLPPPSPAPPPLSPETPAPPHSDPPEGSGSGYASPEYPSSPYGTPDAPYAPPTNTPPVEPGFPWCRCDRMLKEALPPFGFYVFGTFSFLDGDLVAGVIETYGDVEPEDCDPKNPCCQQDKVQKLEFHIKDKCKGSVADVKLWTPVFEDCPYPDVCDFDYFGKRNPGYQSYGTGKTVFKISNLGLSINEATNMLVTFFLPYDSSCPTIDDLFAAPLVDSYMAVFDTTNKCCPTWWSNPFFSDQGAASAKVGATKVDQSGVASGKPAELVNYKVDEKFSQASLKSIIGSFKGTHKHLKA